MSIEKKGDNQSCIPISFSSEANGQVSGCELLIQREGKLFTLRIGTPQYILRLQERNRLLPEEYQLDTNILPFMGVMDPNQICQTLSGMPFETLSPYLTEQNQTKNSP